MKFFHFIWVFSR